GPDLLFLLWRERTGEQQRTERPAEPRGREHALQRAEFATAEEARERAVVLLGKDFRGRHERGLVARPDRGQHRSERHDRLARADVALEEPEHRLRSANVV